MLVQISHERSQVLLRQRNLFALTSAGLAIALVVAGGFAATRDREVVLVPTVRAPLEERPISIFGAEARKNAERVLCSPNPETSLHAAYSGIAVPNPKPKPKPCDTRGLDANEAFAKANGFNGTPVIVRPSDGAVLEGYRDAAALRAFLSPTQSKG